MLKFMGKSIILMLLWLVALNTSIYWQELEENMSWTTAWEDTTVENSAPVEDTSSDTTEATETTDEETTETTSSEWTWEEDIFWDLDLWEEDSSSSETNDMQLNDVWGYTQNDVLEIVVTWDNSITIKSPIVLDGLWEQIKRYKIIFSNTPIDTTDSTQLKEQNVSFDSFDKEFAEIEFKDLTKWTQYYVVIVPINKDNINWEKSKEFSFIFEWTTLPVENAVQPVNNTTLPVEWTTQPTSWEMMWAPNTQADLKDVSYSMKDNWITLKWTNVEWIAKVDVFVRWEKDQDFKKVWSANMKDWQFTFNATQTWNVYAKLIPTNDIWEPVWREVVQAIKVESTPTPKITTVPEVWPELNYIIAFITLMLVWYLLFVVKKYSTK